MGNEGAKYISEGLKTNTSLVQLNLRTNCIGDAGIRFICTALGVNKTVSHLSLAHNEAKKFKCVGEMLKVNKGLWHLNLEDNKVEDKAAKAIGEGLKVNKTLLGLDLGYTYIMSEGIKAISEGLEVNIALRKLYLWWVVGNFAQKNVLNEAFAISLTECGSEEE
eukprot:TRINITY_DN1415_c0_g4_i2.p1 TRINITY_DN1415_c0_g4~~TRINITY_DN1415_c0_g4_i2.p1  ORF type:complete len:164 (-),score=19.04 TRINITY_DN1415_c0_g4_i2:148-639(-)